MTDDIRPMKRVLSLGAGVQSTTVLRLAIHGEIERPDHVIFADTGWEPQDVYDHLDVLEREMNRAGIGFSVVENGHIYRDHITASGPSGDGSNPPALPYYTLGKNGKGAMPRQCTNNYKIIPFDKEVRKIFGITRKTRHNCAPVVEVWYGISTDEIRRTRLSGKWWQVNHYPLIELGMSRSDCLSWMRENGYSDPPRSACVACPYKSDREWRFLRDTSPDEFAEACDFDDAIRTKLGFIDQRFVHPSCVPLREVDFSTPEDHGQLNMFRDNECAGMCGV